MRAHRASDWSTGCRVDFARRWWHERAAHPGLGSRADENVFSALLHLVERGDLRHAAVDLALRRARGRGRVWQPLLPHQGRQDRSDARLRAALGDLQRHRRSLDRAAVLAWLAAPHGRHAADAGKGHAAAVVEAPPAQSHRHARRPPPDRLDAGAGPQAEGDRRLQALDARPLAGVPTPERPFPRRILGVNRQACPPVFEHRPMARLLRIACFVAAPIAAWATLGVLPAAAQFFNPFEALFGQPPRPPSSVPSGRPQQGYPQYPDQRYPDQRYPDQRYPEQQQYPDQPYPGQARQAPPGGVQSQPLPPPEGAAAAVDPPGQRQPRGTPQPADTSPQPGDEVIAEPPSQKIANKSAMFSGLDKITGRIIAFDAAIGETVQFGALQVTPRVCYTRPPTETSNTDAFIEVDEVTLQGDVKRIFTGWMFAASPGLHAVEHPIYDVWLTDCKNPVVAATAPTVPEPPPAAAAPAAKPPAATPSRRSSQQAAPQLATEPAAPRR